MTVEDEDRDATTAWLLDTYRAVQNGNREADSVPTLLSLLTDALATVSGTTLAYIATTGTGDGEIQIIASADDFDLPDSISLDDDEPEQSPTYRAIETGDVVTGESSDENPELTALAESGDTEDVGCWVSIPLTTENAAAPKQGSPDSPCATARLTGQYGVLHLLTSPKVTDAESRSSLNAIGDSIVTGIEATRSARERARTRARLERLRSAVSHDFGNPINLASGRLELAAEDCESEHLDSATDALEALDGLIDTNLRYVRAGYPVEDAETVDLEAIARECWRDLEVDGAADGDSFEIVDDLPEVCAESKRVRHLLFELFENALAHGDGDIEVRMGTLPETAGFYVADTGPGIPEDEREYVFEPGYAIEAGRTGAGLTIVSEIVDAHDWELGLIESKAGGARFEIATDQWIRDWPRQ